MIKKIVEMRKKVKLEPVIDGKAGFIYIDKNNNLWSHCTGRNIFNISEKNTIIFIVSQMPIITPHVCRMTDEDWRLADRSKKLRVQELKEMRENKVVIHGGLFSGKLLADLLEKDLREHGDILENVA